MRIVSPVPHGSGAALLHEILASAIEGYHVQGYEAWLECFPPLLLRERKRAPIVHAPPDHAVLTAHPTSSLVVTFHNYVLDAEMGPYVSLAQRLHYSTDLRWLIRRAVRRASVVTAVSHQTRELVRENLRFGGEIQVIPNGIDIERFTPRPEAHANIRVLFCGNLTKRKGGHLIPAVAERLDSGIELIVATGLRSGRRSHRTKNVHSLGRIPPDDMAELYNRVDILFHPSIREGLSLTVMEAMACGLPVITSSASSLSELVHDGRGGYHSPPGDVEMFAQRINHLAGQSALRASMGQYNRSRVESDFRRDQMIDSYKRIFRDLLAN